MHSKLQLRVVTILFFATISCIPLQASGKDILFFFGLSTYSHRITAWPLAVQLAEKGHSVTFLQPVVNRDPHPKITDMHPKGMVHRPPENLVDIRLQYGRLVPAGIVFNLPTWGFDMCEEFLNNTENLEWVSSRKFDVVILDALFNDCGYGLAHKWNAKTIIFSTTHMFEWLPDSLGFADESWWIPGIHYAQEIPLGFLERVQSQLSYFYAYFNRELRGLPRLDELLRRHLKMPDMPTVSDLVRNTSLLFVNTHFSEEVARSLPPNVIPIGGMHVTGTVKPLPEEMEKFVQGSGDSGFIYISFGSEADMATSPQYLRDIFFNAIRKTKARFLWRWNGDRSADMPDNVLTSKWMPQQDILGHPKCKGFMTHGGLLSMQEAVIHAVPMVVFPIFAEQDYNAERLQRTGRGIRLDIATVTQPQLENALNRLLTDSSLKHQMTLTSVRFKDRPAKPVDTAVWWVEYILRHEDTSFMRPLATSLTWYQRRLWDAWAFLALTLFTILYLLIKFVKICLSLCCGGGGSSKTKTKVKNAKKTN